MGGDGASSEAWSGANVLEGMEEEGEWMDQRVLGNSCIEICKDERFETRVERSYNEMSCKI